MSVDTEGLAAGAEVDPSFQGLTQAHLVAGVDHTAYPTFDPAGTVSFYHDVLKFPIAHAICATGWGPPGHPDFVHFFFDIGDGDRLAFFYYFGFPQPPTSPQGDVYAGFEADVARFFVRSRHLAIHVPDEDSLLEYRRRLDASQWPVESLVRHETIESIYTTDPNGYMFEITCPLRPLTSQETLDAELTVAALVDTVTAGRATMAGLLERKAMMIRGAAGDNGDGGEPPASDQRSQGQ